MSLETENLVEYEKKYDNDYGLKYPDGHIIRSRHLFLRDPMFEGSNLCDFGCGNGIHAQYLYDELKVHSYCYDTSEKCIRQCLAKNEINKFSDHIEKIDLNQNIYELAKDVKFNIILANQVLYYMETKNVEDYVDQFYKMLNQNGLVIATFMAKTNYYYSLSEETDTDFRKVTLTGRLNETTYINFFDKEDVLKLFQKFETVCFGYYDQDLTGDGSTLHYIYIGKKNSDD